MAGFSLSWLRREKDELLRDRAAFASALDILKRRILDSNETDLPRNPVLHQWSGSRACVGSLELSLNAIERTLEEVDRLISQIEDGEVVDLDVPAKSSPGESN